MIEGLCLLRHRARSKYEGCMWRGMQVAMCSLLHFYPILACVKGAFCAFA